MQHPTTTNLSTLQLCSSLSDIRWRTEFTSLFRYKGKELSGLQYEPLFDYFAHRRSSGAFRVLTDNYVTDSSGTGIVHQAPYFGEVSDLTATVTHIIQFVSG